MPWLLLATSLVNLLLAINVLRPVHRPALVSIPGFFAGWLVGELALHHILLQVVLVAALAASGALGRWPGWLALPIFAAAWALLYRGWARSRDAGHVIDDALRAALGDDYDDAIPPESLARLDGHPDWGAVLAPFPIRHHEVVCTRDLVYHEEGRLRLRLDVYRHKDGPKNAPAFLYVHGGAWIIGRKHEQGLPLLHHLASLGWTCFTIDYRKSPRATFPDHLVDVKRAIRWVKEHAAEHGADPSFVVIGGNSAGGHLSSLAALTADDKRYQPGFESASCAVAGCVSFYGVYDLSDRHGSYSHRQLIDLLERHVLKARLDEARDDWDAASPIMRVHEAAPPFLLIHGDHDTLVPIGQARHFAAAYRKAARAPLALAEIPGAQHAFEVFPSLRTELTIRGVARYCTWLHATHAAAKAPRSAAE